MAEVVQMIAGKSYCAGVMEGEGWWEEGECPGGEKAGELTVLGENVSRPLPCTRQSVFAVHRSPALIDTSLMPGTSTRVSLMAITWSARSYSLRPRV